MSDTETHALAKVAPRGLAKRHHTLELEVTVDEALDRFREQIGVPVLAKKHASLPPSGIAFAEIEGDRFMLHHPIKSAVRHRDVGIGPGVEGQLYPTDGGSRLELRSRLWAPTRSQAWKLSGVGTLLLLGLSGMLAAKALGLTLLMTLGTLVYLGFYARRLRQRELDLLARVQRVFGPVARTAIDEPYRGGRRALPGKR